MNGEAGMRVAHLMNGVILHADAAESLIYITRLLVENNANAIIVREGGVPKGIITSKDIVRSLIKYNKDAERISAKEVMTAPIITVSHNSDIDSARRLMLDSGRQKLPVKKEIDIIGLLVQADIIRDLSWYR